GRAHARARGGMGELTRIAGLVVACVACTKATTPPAPQPGPSHEPAVAVAHDAAPAPPIDAAPPRCSAATFGMHAAEPPRRAIDRSCALRNIRREFHPQQFDYDALTARLDKTQWKRTAGVLLIEIRRPADIAKVWRCTSLAKIDWAREHIWVAIYGADS